MKIKFEGLTLAGKIGLAGVIAMFVLSVLWVFVFGQETGVGFANSTVAGSGVFPVGNWLKVLWSNFKLPLIGLLALLGIYIIRKTKTTKDDELLDNFIAKGVQYAVGIMPKDCKIDSIKFLGNALAEFVEVYTKTQKVAPDGSILKYAKIAFEEIAKSKQEFGKLPMPANLNG
jgi:hypothetical protein